VSAAIRITGAANTKLGVEKRGGGNKITVWRSRPFGRHRVGGRRSRFSASRKSRRLLSFAAPVIRIAADVLI
jgi:hypothetical protein